MLKVLVQSTGVNSLPVLTLMEILYEYNVFAQRRTLYPVKNNANGLKA